MLRTITAIIAGFLLMVIIVIVGSILATTLFVTGGIAAMRELHVELPMSYLATNLVISLLAAGAGGWLASRLDEPGRWRTVAGLAAAVLVMSVTNMGSQGGPGGKLPWYPWAVAILGVAGVLIGGWTRMSSVAFPTTRGPSDPM